MLTTSASYDCVSFYLFHPGTRSRILLFLGMVARPNQLIHHRYRCCCCYYYCLCTTQLRILLFALFPIASPRNLGVGSVLLFSQPRPWAIWRREDGTRIWRLSRLNSTGLTQLLILKTIPPPHRCNGWLCFRWDAQVFPQWLSSWGGWFCAESETTQLHFSLA